MTDAHHPNGTSRLAQAARELRLSSDTIVVNIQGDEPELESAAINAAVAALHADPHASVATIASPFTPEQSPTNPAIVKVVVSRAHRALYFSRSLIPFPRDTDADAPPLRHVGLYAYRAAFLETYASLAPTPLERAESLEQLRVLEHGFAIAVAVCKCDATGIDTPEQYAAFVARQRER